jgi:hypothetical protein
MSDYYVTRNLPVHDASGPVTCAACGCRLLPLSGPLDGAYRHYPSMTPGQDARGCRTACADELHDHDGRVMAAAAA